MVTFTVECELPLSPNDMWRIRSSTGFRRHVVEDGLLKRLDSSCEKKGDDGWTVRTQRYVPVKVDFPDFLRAVIGDAMFDVTDEQRFNEEEAPLCQQFRIRPTMFAALSTTTGTLTLAPVGADDADKSDSEDEDRPTSISKDGSDIDTMSSDGSTDPADSGDSDDSEAGGPERSEFAALPPEDRCIHIVQGDTKVNVPTVGWLVERQIVANLRLFYKLYPATVGRFRRKLYDQFAGGDTSVPCSVVIDRFLKHEEETESVSDGEGMSDMNPPEKLLAPAFAGDFNARLFAPGELMNFDRNSRAIEEDFESFFVSA